MRELPPDGGANERHIFARAKPVQARHQRSLQRRWNGERRQRSVEHVAPGGLTQWPALDQHARQLLEEQRHAIRMRKDLLDDRIGQRLAAA